MEENTQDASQTATEQADSSTVQTESAATDTQIETVPKKDWNKLYWQKKDLERKLEAIEEAKNSQSVQTTLSTKEPEKAEAEPTLEQFDYDHDAFTAALVDHKVKKQVSQAFSQTKEQEQKRKQAEEEQQLSKSFNDRYADYISQNPDYAELAEKFGGKVYNNTVNQAIYHDENGPAIDHYLMTNPEIAEKVNGMNPVLATMEIGKISARLSTQPKTKPTNAPAPFETVSGGANAGIADVRYSENASMKDYYAASMARKRGG